MADYLIQVSYTPEAWAALIKNPQNRVEVVRMAIENLGGTIENAWFAFGEYDVILAVQMPDNVSAAAFAIAVSAGGALKSIRTTPLMSVESGLEALRKAAGTGYQPPAM